MEICDSISDIILQPTYHPLRPNVKPFFFHGYDASWEVPLDFDNKEFGMVYVGNNWFRWRSLERVLGTLEPVLAARWPDGDRRQRMGPPRAVGEACAARGRLLYRSRATCGSLGVEVIPPIRFDEVIGWMSRGVFSPVIYRPLFDHLQSCHLPDL